MTLWVAFPLARTEGSDPSRSCARWWRRTAGRRSSFRTIRTKSWGRPTKSSDISAFSVLAGCRNSRWRFEDWLTQILGPLVAATLYIPQHDPGSALMQTQKAEAASAD